MVTPATFKLRFPSFAGLTDARVQMFIDDADPAFNVCRWGGYYDLGLANYVAHELTMAAALEAGPKAALLDATIAKKVDVMSITFDAILKGKVVENPYLATVYGQKYLYYRDLISPGALAV